MSLLPILRNIAKGREMLTLMTLATAILPLLCLLLALSNSLWKPLPYTNSDDLMIAPDSQQLAEVWEGDPQLRNALLGVKNAALFSTGEGNLAIGKGTAQHIRYAVVSARFLQTLGVRLQLGALPLPANGLDPLGRPLILSSRFARRGDATGVTATVNGMTARLYGFVDDATVFPRGVDAWLVREKAQDALFRGAIRYTTLWRLQPGTSMAVASEQIFSEEQHRGFAQPNAIRENLTPLHDYLFRDRRASLQLAYWITGALFLIGMTNSIAAYCYELLRTQRDLALKLALGSSYVALAAEVIIRQELYATAGWIIAALIAPVFTASVGDYIGVLQGPWGLNGPAILSLLASLVAVWTAALIVALSQLWIIRRLEVTSVLQESSRSIGNTRTGQTIQNGIIFLQIALVTALLTGGVDAGVRYWEFTRIPLGFQTRDVLTADADLEAVPADARAQQVMRLVRAMESDLRARRAGAINYLPLDSRQSVLFGVKAAQDPSARMVPAGLRVIEGEYFEAVGQPLLEGRAFLPRLDQATAPCHVIVNRMLASRLFPVETAVGRSLVLAGPREVCEIVGIVGDVRHFGPAELPVPEFYMPLAHMPWPTMTLVASGPGAEASGLLERARIVISGLSGAPVTIAAPVTLEQRLETILRPSQSRALMIAAISAVAFGLTLLGVYGVVAQRMASRSRRIALELALGASGGQVMRNVFGAVFVVILAGTIAGGSLGAGLALGSGNSSLERTLGTAGATSLIVAAVAVGAAYAAVRGTLSREPSDVLRWSC